MRDGVQEIDQVLFVLQLPFIAHGFRTVLQGILHSGHTLFIGAAKLIVGCVYIADSLLFLLGQTFICITQYVLQQFHVHRGHGEHILRRDLRGHKFLPPFQSRLDLSDDLIHGKTCGGSVIIVDEVVTKWDIRQRAGAGRKGQRTVKGPCDRVAHKGQVGNIGFLFFPAVNFHCHTTVAHQIRVLHGQLIIKHHIHVEGVVRIQFPRIGRVAQIPVSTVDQIQRFLRLDAGRAVLIDRCHPDIEFLRTWRILAFCQQ